MNVRFGFWKIECNLLVAVFFAVFPSSFLQADTVHRRGGLPSLEGAITKFDDGGVTIQRSNMSEADFVRWDMVRTVVKDKHDPLLDQYKERAENLWRARVRLERNDTALAEPLFDRLFETYRGKTNEAALLVAEGLLRCRLARGSNDAAIIPALEAIRIRRALKGINVYAVLPPMFDERTQLCMLLPPAWVNSTYLARLDRDLAAYNAGSDTAVAAMAYLYRYAIALQLGLRFEEGERVLAADHPGVALLTQMVALMSTDEARRVAARQIIERDQANMPAWAQAWSHYFVGMSWLANGDASMAPRGMVAMAHVPATFGSVQPYLAGLILARLAEFAEGVGEVAAANSLRHELNARFPYHPVITTIRRRTAANAAASNPYALSTSFVKEST